MTQVWLRMALEELKIISAMISLLKSKIYAG
jgi:hypothetical protein